MKKLNFFAFVAAAYSIAISSASAGAAMSVPEVSATGGVATVAIVAGITAYILERKNKK